MRLTYRSKTGKLYSHKSDSVTVVSKEALQKLADYEDAEERHTMKIELTDEEYKELIDLVKAGICKNHWKCSSYGCDVCHERNPLYAKLKAREGKE